MVHTLNHPVLGQITYIPRQHLWTGWIRLPLFTALTSAAVQEADQESLRELWKDHPDAQLELAQVTETEEDQRLLRGEFPLEVEPPFTRKPGLRRLSEWWRERGKPPPQPASSQVNAFRFLVTNEPRTFGPILEKTYAQYSKEWENWRKGASAVGRDEILLPFVDSPDGLKRLIRLTSVTLLGSQSLEIAPVRYRFICSWDHEHGYELYSLADQVFFDEPC